MNNAGLVKPDVRDGKCPHCDIYREWSWDYFIKRYDGQPLGCVTYCNQCKNHTIYYKGKIIYPKNTLLMKPDTLFDRYEKSKKLFLEAVEVSPISPRAGLTLARMCLESLTNEILQEHNEKIDENFHNNIEKLYKLDIINAKLKTLLSSARIISNKTTHNFYIIDTENEPNLEDAEKVLRIVNYILENIRIAVENEKDLLELEERVKEKNAKKTNDN